MQSDLRDHTIPHQKMLRAIDDLETASMHELDAWHQERLSSAGLTRRGRLVLFTATTAVVLLAACASPQVVTVDRVAAAKSRITSERNAGIEARAECASLGMESDRDCRREIAGARLGLDANAPLGKFVKVD